jgi:hypothetical protein
MNGMSPRILGLNTKVHDPVRVKPWTCQHHWALAASREAKCWFESRDILLFDAQGSLTAEELEEVLGDSDEAAKSYVKCDWGRKRERKSWQTTSLQPSRVPAHWLNFYAVNQTARLAFAK